MYVSFKNRDGGDADCEEPQGGVAGLQYNATYAVEVKTTACYEKSPAAVHEQMAQYMDQQGVGEGWLVVADSDALEAV